MNTVWGQPKWVCFPVYLLTACRLEVFRGIEECFDWAVYFGHLFFKPLFLMIIFLNDSGHFFWQRAAFWGDCLLF
jgi:hypothetical protein